MISFNAMAKDSIPNFNQLTSELKTNPENVIKKTELLIDESQNEANLALRFLQIKAYVANDLDMRLIPKLKQLKKLANELNNNKILVEIFIYQAMVAKRNEHYSDALKYNYKALMLSEKLNSREVKTRALKNIAQLYLALEHYKKSLTYYDSALLLNDKIDVEESSNIMMEKGLVYLAMGNYFQAKSMLTTALYIIKPNYINSNPIKVYLGQLYIKVGKYKKSLSYLESLSEQDINSLPSEIKRDYFESLAKAHLQKGDFTKAIEIAKNQLKHTSNTRFLFYKTNLQKIIAQSYFQQFDYESAYTFLQRHALLQQAMHEKLRDSKVLQLEAQFTKQQQESKIKILEQDSALQKSLYDNKIIAQDKKHQEEQHNQKLLIISAVILLIILFFIVRQIQVRKYTKQLEHKVKERTKELADKNNELEELTLLDQLTGLHNRRFLYQSIENDISLVNRYYHKNSLPLNNSVEQVLATEDNNTEQDLVFILIDLDHFKQVNDKYGHSAGDSVLVQMKTLIKQTFRESDFFIRWGGEEFLVVTRYVDRKNINIMVERFRLAVANHTFIFNDIMAIQCTCSIGFAAYPFVQMNPKAFSWEQVIDIADIALYTAKEKQRNAWVGLSAGKQLEKQLSSASADKESEESKDSYSITRIKNDTVKMFHENKIDLISSITTHDISTLFNN
jgi:diguanylate cyclase (GGDEF)-like protein